MEKQQSPSGSVPVDLDMLKIEPNHNHTSRDVDFGQVLETCASPEMERKVLWKLDLL